MEIYRGRVGSCLKETGNHIANMESEDFENDGKTVDAVVRNLEVIGEASKNIPEEIKLRYQNVYWKGIIGLRNRIIHEYFGVDLKIVWHILTKELPPLRKQMEQILEEERE